MPRSNRSEARAVRLSGHARARMQQRGATMAEVDIALQHGEARWSRGDRVHVLTDRTLRGTPWEDQADRLRGLTVVVTVDGTVRTVKWDFKVRSRPGVLRRACKRRGRSGDELWPTC